MNNFLTNLQKEIDKAHLVFITDDTNVSVTFNSVKQLLISPVVNSIKVLYKHEKNLYSKEWTILEKSFSNTLQTYKTENNEELQEFIEAVINSNTYNYLHFLIVAEDDFSNAILEKLLFLSIDKQAITIF